MTTKWTPEPWTYLDGQNKKLFHIESSMDAHESGVSVCSVVHEPNAARIVECVNAMANIENPEEFVRRARDTEVQIEKLFHFKATEWKVLSLEEQLKIKDRRIAEMEVDKAKLEEALKEIAGFYVDKNGMCGGRAVEIAQETISGAKAREALNGKG